MSGGVREWSRSLHHPPDSRGLLSLSSSSSSSPAGREPWPGWHSNTEQTPLRHLPGRTVRPPETRWRGTEPPGLRWGQAAGPLQRRVAVGFLTCESQTSEPTWTNLRGAGPGNRAAGIGGDAGGLVGWFRAGGRSAGRGQEGQGWRGDGFPIPAPVPGSTSSHTERQRD